ncbi:MAG TPA: hypothetical protein VIZ43_10160 [Trebonia sp.]
MGKRLRIAVVISAFAMTAALGTLVPAAAEAATPAVGTVTTDFGGHLQEHVVDAALATQINSGNWKGLSVEQLASAGIYPGMGNKSTDVQLPPPVAVAKPPSIITPDTGSGCNFNATAGSMCIYVTGTGLKTTEWDSSVSNPLGIDTCTYAGYWVNGQLLTTSNEVCGDGAFWAYDSGTVTWPNQTKLCNTWVNFGGEPCITVHT